MIELTLLSGAAVFVNPAHIVSVARSANNFTYLVAVTGYTINVVDTVQTVVDLIEEHNKKEEAL